MIIWSGYGILVVPVFLASLLGSMVVTSLITGSDEYGRLHNWPSGIGLILGGIVCWFLGRWLRDRGARALVDPKTGQQVIVRRGRSFFFIPMEVWGVLLVLIGIGTSFIHHTPEELRQRDAEREFKKELRESLKNPQSP